MTDAVVCAVSAHVIAQKAHLRSGNYSSAENFHTRNFAIVPFNGSSSNFAMKTREFAIVTRDSVAKS